ncbi:MAG: lytic transglycosylase domain-containing protein [Erythrobacter sp.]
MSSMVRKHLSYRTLLALPLLVLANPVPAQEAASWDQARAKLIAQQPTRMTQAVSRWEDLIANDRLGFDAYAGFVLAYPDFPQESRLRIRAENALDNEAPSSEALLGYFDKNPPLTNSGRARYALALAAFNRPKAPDMAREAWRMGSMSGTAEAYLLGLYGSGFSADDHAARMDALLWQGDEEAAVRQMINVGPETRDLYMARLSLIEGKLPQASGLSVPADARSDPGYVYNLVRHYRKNRQLPQAIALLANRPQFTRLPHDAEDLVGEMLTIAKGAGSSPAVKIAASVDDLFPAGADISKGAYRLRDDYTSLMWLGGTKALWNLSDGKAAAPLFYRYGAAARTPQTRSKGFYWAGLASQRAGDSAEATRYWEMAAAYPDRFYGMLALDRLGRSVPALNVQATAEITPEQRAAFNAQPLTKAVREVARGVPWRTGIRFFRAIADQAETPADHLLVAELARETGRRDLAVNLAEAAQAHGHAGFTVIGHPTLQNPQGTDWTMVHAITRQESQFAQNAISHAGARGLMQLMPATAREQAGKLSMSYMRSNLIDSPSYNIRLGDAYFARMLAYYDGAYPLAIAAYNAGPGNVNKWLRRNGDPRTSGKDWVTWMEQIPIFETKNYVQRVIENAAVYEQLHPDRNVYGIPRTAASFLR